MPKVKSARSARIHLTDAVVRKLPTPTRAEVYKLYRDDVLPGMCVRVTYHNCKSFVLNYSTKTGRERRYTLGRWPTWSVQAAREKLQEFRQQIDLGADPMADKQQARGALTLGQLCDEFKERHTTKGGRRLKDGHRDVDDLEREVLPQWEHRVVSEITRAEIIKLIEKKAEEAPVAANRLLALLSRVWNFGIEKDLVPSSPVVGIKAPTKEKPKDRVLTEAEIKKLWKGLDKVRSSGADVLKLILLTMQRPGELCALPWFELDLDTAIWSLPAARAKNGLAHRIPLTETALEIIKAQPRGSRYVFPGKQTGSHLDTGSVSRLLNEHEQFGVAKFTPHDLRRTAASHAARIEVPRLVVQRLLNHAERGTTGQVYERYGYDKEKRDGLVKLERELLRILGRSKPGNVVAIAG